MNDKEMLEEMVEEILQEFTNCYSEEDKDCLIEIIRNYIPKNAVVLAKEEINKKYVSVEMYELAKAFHNEKCAEFEKLCYDYLKLKDIINEKIASEIADYVAKTRKETAVVFAEKLENGIDNLDIILHEDNDEQYVSVNQLLEFIDEIAKQFSNEIKE